MPIDPVQASQLQAQFDAQRAQQGKFLMNSQFTGYTQNQLQNALNMVGLGDPTVGPKQGTNGLPFIGGIDLGSLGLYGVGSVGTNNVLNMVGLGNLAGPSGTTQSSSTHSPFSGINLGAFNTTGFGSSSPPGSSLSSLFRTPSYTTYTRPPVTPPPSSPVSSPSGFSFDIDSLKAMFTVFKDLIATLREAKNTTPTA